MTACPPREEHSGLIQLNDDLIRALERISEQRSVSVPDLVSELISNWVADQERAFAETATRKDPSVSPQPSRREAPQVSHRFRTAVSQLGTPSRIHEILSECFVSLGLDVQELQDIETSSGRAIVAWVAQALKMGSDWTAWLDFVISIDEASCRTLYQTMVGSQPEGDADLTDIVAEALNIMQGAVKASFEKEGVLVALPFLPKAVKRATTVVQPSGSAMGFAKRYVTPGLCMDVGILENLVVCERSSLDRLQVYDVLATDVVPKGAGMTLVKAWTPLTERLIEKLIAFQRREPVRVEVLRPSASSQWAFEVFSEEFTAKGR